MGAAIFCDVQLEIVLRRKTGAAKHENMREVFPPGAPGIAHVHESRRAGPGVFSRRCRLPGSPRLKRCSLTRCRPDRRRGVTFAEPAFRLRCFQKFLAAVDIAYSSSSTAPASLPSRPLSYPQGGARAGHEYCGKVSSKGVAERGSSLAFTSPPGKARVHSSSWRLLLTAAPSPSSSRLLREESLSCFLLQLFPASDRACGQAVRCLPHEMPFCSV